MKSITIKIADFNDDKGFEYEWERNFKIIAAADNSLIHISANKEGLISLATHLLSLSQCDSGTHLHYDDINSLENGSAELIIEKIE